MNVCGIGYFFEHVCGIGYFFELKYFCVLYMRCDLRESSTEQRRHADWMECICWQASNQTTRSTYRHWILAQHLAIYVYVLLFGVPYFTDLGMSYFPRAERLPFFSYQRPCAKIKIFQIILFLQWSQMGEKKRQQKSSRVDSLFWMSVTITKHLS